MRTLLAACVAISSVLVVQGGPSTPADAACTSSNLSAAALNSIFKNPGIGRSATVPGYAGGDYQRVYPVSGGRYLWLFQDVFFSNDNDLRDSKTAAAHNAGLVQTGTCFTLVGGPYMKNYIGSKQTTPLSHWFWPMDGEMGADGNLWVFMAEFRNPAGTGAGYGAAPVGTWVARINPTTLQVISFGPARNASRSLYGWSIVNDSRYSYLYGHCYRQYAHKADSAAQFDATCMPSTYVARVPKGRFDLPPVYWTGSSWSANGASARPVMTRGAANPMDVRYINGKFVNVTKADDWWGTKIHVDTAPTPMGPWTNRNSVSVPRKCTSGCGNYHATLLPYQEPDGRMVVAISNGGKFSLWYANAFLYRVSFLNIPAP